MLVLIMAGKGRYLGSFSPPEIFGVLCPLSELKRREELNKTKPQFSV